MDIAFSSALSAYLTARAVSDAIPLGTPGEDEAIDAYCNLMDVVIETPAPDHHALLIKYDLIREREEGFGGIDWMQDAFRADFVRLIDGAEAAR